ncbi:MAG TPA: sugar-binding domain-containing protein, partial [Allocoleopsis sp.]
MSNRLAKLGLILVLSAVLFGAIGLAVRENYFANRAIAKFSSTSLLQSNSKRGQLYLNGVWQFIPVNSASEQQPPQSGWGSISVPGDWQRENDDSIPGVISRGTGKAWENFNGQKLAKAWYQRTVTIPEEWQGRSLFLDIGRVSTDAVVYVTGVKCGEVNWPYGAVDISKLVKPGQEVTLAVLVVTVRDEKEKTIIMGPNEVYTTEATLDSRGLIGEVRLLSLPQGPHVSDVFVQPSTRQKQVKLDVELTGVTQAGNAQVRAKMLDEKGNVEREFTTTAQVQAKQRQTLQLVWDWPNPRLWDVGQPNLYTLQLDVKGSGIDDEYNQQFGFREFWIEGRKFYLNGTEIRLRPVLHDDTW